MSEIQGQLFHMKEARDRKERELLPLGILALGDKLHDVGLHEEAIEVIDMYKTYMSSLEYYESLVTQRQPDNPA